MFSGYGKLYYKDGSFYFGHFENGEKNGFGKMVFSEKDDRDSFEGIRLALADKPLNHPSAI